MAVTIDNLNTNILSVKSSKNSTWYSTAKVFNIQDLVKDIVPDGMKLTQIRIKIVNTRTGTTNTNMTSGRIDSFKLQKETRDSIELEICLDDVNKLIELYAYEDINTSLPNNQFFDILDGTHIDLKISAQGYISNRVWYDTTTKAFLTGVMYEEESSIIQTSLELVTTRKTVVNSLITNETDRKTSISEMKKNKGFRTTITTFKNEIRLKRKISKLSCKYVCVTRKVISNYRSKYLINRKSVIDLEIISRLGRKVMLIFNNNSRALRGVFKDNILVKSALRKVELQETITSQSKRKVINCANKNNWFYRKTVSDNASINSLNRKLVSLKNYDFNAMRFNVKAESKKAMINRNVSINNIVSTKLRRPIITDNSISRAVHRIAVKDVNAINYTLRPAIVLSKNTKVTIKKNIVNFNVDSVVKRTSIKEYLDVYKSNRATSIDKTISKKTIRCISVNSLTKVLVSRRLIADETLKAITIRATLANKLALCQTLREILDGHLSIRTIGDTYGYSGGTYFRFISGTSLTTRYELFNVDGTEINKIYESSLVARGTADLDSTFSTITNICTIRYNLKRDGISTSTFESDFYQNTYAIGGAFKNVVYVLPLEASEDKAKFYILKAVSDTDKEKMIISDGYVEADIIKGTIKQYNQIINEDSSMQFAIPTTKAPTYRIVGYQRNEIILDFTGCNDFIVINTKANIFRRIPRVNIRLDATLCKASNGYKQVSIVRPTSSTNIEVRFDGSGKVIAIDTGATNIKLGRVMYDAYIDKYYFTQTVKVNDINYLKKYIMDINGEEIVSEEILEERGRNSAQTQITGLLGGGLGYPGNRYLYIPYLTDSEFDGKIHVLYKALLKRTSHIDFKPKLNIERHITNINSVTGHLNRKINVSDELVNMAARKALNDNIVRAVYMRSTRLDLGTYFNNHRLTLKDNSVAGATLRRTTEDNVIVKKFNSNRMILIDAINDNSTSRMAIIESDMLSKAIRSTLVNKVIVGPTGRAIVDINVTIYEVDTLRKIMANNINAKPLTRSSHLNVEDQLNTKRSISNISRLNEHMERFIGCSSFVNGYITRNIIEVEEKSFNTERKNIASYNRVANANRRLAIINNITGSTERTVISHYDYTKIVPTSRTTIIGNISNYSTQRKVKALMINDYKTLRVVTLRATDAKTYYFNAIVPVRIDEYPIHYFNMKINLINEYLAKVTMGMDFN
ncbi:hypothetical protein [Clostridium chrysemydis]|uniref:hypothetical protein n=1 Tax=Clostridium chrysemydis TaxID=2665504 RepID=UPI00188445B4|nr:hypothetical protein [Clostridium chrysemydis]